MENPCFSWVYRERKVLKLSFISNFKTKHTFALIQTFVIYSFIKIRFLRFQLVIKIWRNLSEWTEIEIYWKVFAKKKENKNKPRTRMLIEREVSFSWTGKKLSEIQVKLSFRALFNSRTRNTVQIWLFPPSIVCNLQVLFQDFQKILSIVQKDVREERSFCSFDASRLELFVFLKNPQTSSDILLSDISSLVIF